jgi:hypothetical protein
MHEYADAFAEHVEKRVVSLKMAKTWSRNMSDH